MMYWPMPSITLADVTHGREARGPPVCIMGTEMNPPTESCSGDQLTGL